ncbi:MAG: hypothetical protein HY000_34740 [Planctomycetes bacterium]|nr:hypothetical protein [Planctomycetota bacterium]
MPRDEVINDPRRPRPAPVEYAGQWVAWDKQQREIVAHGHDLAEVHRSAILAGHPDAVLQKVRRPDVIFIGAT